MATALGIIAFENDQIRVEGLMDYRPVPAISFLGRYRLIDFAVSNLTNSGIQRLKVFVKKQPRSLIEHLGTGRHYNINSKRGSLQILYGESAEVTVGIYNHDINAYLQNMQFIEESKEEYVVIAPGYMVYSIDFNDVLDAHVKTKADVTVVYKRINDAKTNFIGCKTLTLNKDGKIEGADNNLGRYKSRDISLDTYIMTRKLFMELVYKAAKMSSLYTLKDILADSIDEIHLQGYEFKGYCSCINSLERYHSVSMDLINHGVSKQLFQNDWIIHTKTNDSPPAYYSKDSNVKNSLIANGCTIEGELENCVLGRGVTIKKGCKISNSIILPGTYIAEDTVIDYAVVDKNTEIKKTKKIEGTKERLVYIKRRDRI